MRGIALRLVVGTADTRAGDRHDAEIERGWRGTESHPGPPREVARRSGLKDAYRLASSVAHAGVAANASTASMASAAASGVWARSRLAGSRDRALSQSPARCV